jgi:hypothetical protein
VNLSPYVERLRGELLAIARPGESDALVERLVAAVASTATLTMLDLLSAAAAEISLELAPGSVEVRLEANEPVFVVTPAALVDMADDTWADGEGSTPPAEDVADRGGAARINFRPSQELKRRIEAAASREGASVNAWLVRIAWAAVTGKGPGDPRAGKQVNHFIGWVG